MKQTPIPEKIKPQYDKLGFPTGTWMTINSLIDVVTEQQKKIDDLQLRVLSLEEGQEAHVEWHENNRVEDLIPIINEMQGMKPYTAMRITGGLFSGGDKKYCECKEPKVCSPEFLYRCNNGGKCHTCHKPIKPQEDIDKFVDYSINKYGKTYKALGKSQEDIREKLIKLLKIVDNSVAHKPYTAMKSTGEADCCYKNPDCPICSKKIKSSDDIGEKHKLIIIDCLSKHTNIPFIKCIEIADRLLAIVKGE